MRKKIALLAHGPGTYNTINPIIKRLSELNEVTLYATHPYVAKKWDIDIIQEEDYEKIFEKETDLFITGTGSLHNTERLLPVFAKEKNIPVVSILDTFWSTKENLLFRYRNIPNYIIVPTEKNKKDLISLNLQLKEENILVFGNPHFDRLKSYKTLSENHGEKHKAIFFSQCSTSENYSDTSEKSKEALKVMVDLRKKYPDLFHNITVTPHPREEVRWLKNFCQEHHLNFNDKEDSFELLLKSNLSLGVNCTLQYEAEILGIKNVFYTNKKHFLQEILSKNKSISPYNKEICATENIVNWIEKNF